MVGEMGWRHLGLRVFPAGVPAFGRTGHDTLLAARGHESRARRGLDGMDARVTQAQTPVGDHRCSRRSVAGSGSAQLHISTMNAVSQTEVSSSNPSFRFDPATAPGIHVIRVEISPGPYPGGAEYDVAKVHAFLTTQVFFPIPQVEGSSNDPAVGPYRVVGVLDGQVAHIYVE